MAKKPSKKKSKKRTVDYQAVKVPSTRRSVRKKIEIAEAIHLKAHRELVKAESPENPDPKVVATLKAREQEAYEVMEAMKELLENVRDPKSFTPTERRAEMLEMIFEAGSSRTLNRSRLAERYGLRNATTITRDIQALDDYLGA